MPFTLFLTAAYNGGMDIVALLLLAMLNGNEEMKASLRSFLSFYRENRELVAALAGVSLGGSVPEEQKKDRPHEETGEKSILEEYLRRAVQETR